MDLTANGISGGGVAQHRENHLLTDDNAKGYTYETVVPVYDTVTTYTCRRCGATR